jgi:hypothetical protein
METIPEMTVTVLDRAPVSGDAGRVTGEEHGRPDPEVPEKARLRCDSGSRRAVGVPQRAARLRAHTSAPPAATAPASRFRLAACATGSRPMITSTISSTGSSVSL